MNLVLFFNHYSKVPEAITKHLDLSKIGVGCSFPVPALNTRITFVFKEYLTFIYFSLFVFYTIIHKPNNAHTKIAENKQAVFGLVAVSQQLTTTVRTAGLVGLFILLLSLGYGRADI